MVSLFAEYRQPPDEAAFLSHYRTTHVPLAERMPGLLQLTWGRPQTLFSGDAAPFFLVAEMRFTDRDQLMAALRSEEGKAASRDLEHFAKGLVTMRMVEWE